MYKPKYSLQDKTINAISQVGRLYGQLEALKIPQKLHLNLNRDNLIQSSYASNKIEGNPLTLPEVTNLLLDDRVPVNRDEKEVANYFSLLQKLQDLAKKELSLNLVTDIHGQLLAKIDPQAGKIRNQKVVIGKYLGEKGNVSLKVKHDPPFHKQEEIKRSLADLLSWTQSPQDLPAVVKAGIFHHQFVYIHPFEDGNGRVCRLLTALIFLRHNYLINKYFILDDYYDIDRIEYSDKLHSADTGDKTQWLEYFISGVKYSLESALSRTKTALQKLAIQHRPTTKEKEVLKIIQEQPQVTSSEVAERLKVSRQQAHNLLKGLLQKGLISSKGSTKSSYYFLK